MTRLKNAIALSAMGLLFGGAVHAEKAAPLTVIKCAGNDGSTLEQNVYAYTLELDKSTNNKFLTVYLGGSHFNTMLLEEYFGAGYSSCALLNLADTMTTVTIQSVTSSGVGVDVDGGALTEDAINQQYTIVSFAFNGLNIGPSTAAPTSTKPTLSPEAAKAFESFRARGLSMPKH